MDPKTETYDVVIIGGALSGASTAILLLRSNPDLRILIVEKSAAFSRRVGEATVEASTYFLGRVLGLTHYLNESHLVKQGLRFWFANEQVKSLADAGEVGGRYLSRMPSYQIDRATFDEEVLRRACAVGATLLRPAIVSDIRLQSGGAQTLTVTQETQTLEISTRWVIDASGLAALLARQEGWWRPNTEHPTAAAWSRWKDVKDWDSRELAEKFPEWSRAACGIRNTATNHIVGDGWWSWWIPLKGGDVSVGIVFDQRLVDFPREGGNLGDRLKAFLLRHPVAEEMLRDATYCEGDLHWRKNLAYYSTTFAGDGFALVGDAAGFMDPFYSPGMDWISFTASRAAHLVSQSFQGAEMAALISRHNRDFQVCHQRWFKSLYKDKYEYLGEFDLISLAFQLDYSLYVWGVVEQVFREGEKGFLAPPFSPPSGRLFSLLMGCYNKRFAKIARRRRRLGRLGKKNRNCRKLLTGFTLDRKNTLHLIPMLLRWAKLELTEGWTTWFSPTPSPSGEFTPGN